MSRFRRVGGFSLVELLIVMAIILILAALAIPHAKSLLLNASETAVIGELRTIHAAQLQYLSQFREYAGSLADLGPGRAQLIPASLASGDKDGYLFTLARTEGGFAAHADPRVYKETGRRCFYLDETGVVHQNWGRDHATAESPELR